MGECLAALIGSHLADIRRHFGRFSRQVSGYSLEHLLPENGRDLAKMLVGSEGTLVVITQALLRLVPLAQAPTLVVLGYPDMPTAADAVPALLAHAPLAVEGIDAELVEVVRRKKGAVPALPAGGGWLFIEVGAQEGRTSRSSTGEWRRLCVTPGRPTSSSARPAPKPPSCGVSVLTVLAWVGELRPGRPPGRAGKTRPCHPRNSGRTCVTCVDSCPRKA